MRKKQVALIFGGCSPEYSISLSSAGGVLRSMDRERYTPVLIGITQKGAWRYFTGTAEEIEEDRWAACSVPACLCPDRGSRALMVFWPEGGVERVPVDVVLPMLHGKNGEDGTVQGLCELAGLPLAGCGTLSSALCMDKDRAHKLAAMAGVRVPDCVVLEEDWEMQAAREAGARLGYPLFVKPVRAGSSYGVARVAGPEGLEEAIRTAFLYDRQVLLEEAIDGFEVGCAVLGREELITGEPDEIQLAGGFFDFTEKYELVTARIHVPARLPEAKRWEIQERAKAIYRALDCRGFARVDMFVTPSGEIVFNEVNTIPGFTAHSRFPGMMKAAGMDMQTLISRIIESAEA